MARLGGLLFAFALLIIVSQPLTAHTMSDCQSPTGFLSFTAVNFSGGSSLLWAYRGLVGGPRPFLTFWSDYVRCSAELV